MTSWGGIFLFCCSAREYFRTLRKERVENGAIDLSQEGAELKFKIDPDTGEHPISRYVVFFVVVSYHIISDCIVYFCILSYHVK